MKQVIPTKSGQKAMDDRGLTLNQVVELLQNAELIEPVKGHPDRRAFFAGNDQGTFEMWIAPGEKYGEQCWFFLGLRHWHRPVWSDQDTAVVGVEPRRGQRRGHGGAGTMLPTSFAELVRRVEKIPGWTVEHGGKHLKIVGPHGKYVTIPVSTSDHRAVRNAAATLRGMGLDLRRTS